MSDFSMHRGLAGIGDLYLEAYRVLRDPIWLEKAGWIASVLVHSFIQKDEAEGFWVVSADIHPRPELYKGNGGVIHFLLRYMTEGKLNSPFVPL
jgi:hypothetical protein